MEVPKMERKNTQHPAKGSVNPTAAGQAIDHKTAKGSNPNVEAQTKVIQALVTAAGQDPASMQDKTINSIRGKAYASLCGKDGAFSSMFALNPMITADVVNALLDFFLVNSDETHPLEIMEKEPSGAIWSAFFQAYKQPGKATDSNSRNPQQSFRNMLACFPAKAKQVMIALDDAGLKNNWIIPKSSKKVSFSPEDEKEINSLLQKAGVLNPSMELKDRFRIFKALGGRLSSRVKKQQ